jgi:hypothetical protein
MQAIEAAASEPDRPFVLVIEEINRGNPAQIFGEMLTFWRTQNGALPKQWNWPIAKRQENVFMCLTTFT